MLAEGYTSRNGPRGAYVHRDVVSGTLRGRRGGKLVRHAGQLLLPFIEVSLAAGDDGLGAGAGPDRGELEPHERAVESGQLRGRG